MSGWPKEALAKHIAIFESGSRPKGGVSKYTKGIPSISAEQILPEGLFVWDKIKFVPESFYKRSAKGQIRTNDVLIVKDGATTGKTAFVDIDFPFTKAMINEHTYLLRTKTSLLPKFLFYFLQSNNCTEFFAIKRQHGVIGGLNNSFIEEISLPVPPISEQHRIVTRIEELIHRVKEVRKLRQETFKEIKTIISSCLKTFLDSYDYDQTTLKNYLSEKPRNGWSPVSHSVGGGIPVLTLAAVTGFKYNPNKIKWTTEKTKPDAHYWLKKGELLITRSNTPELVGHAAIYNGEPKNCICPDLIMKMTVNNIRANLRFIHYWLQSETVRKYIIENARGTSNSMKKINQGHVLNIPVPELTIEDQNRITSKMDTVSKYINQFTEHQSVTENKLMEFESALIAKAFQEEL